MDEQSKAASQYIDTANKLYSMLNKKLKNFIISKRLCSALNEIKESIEDLNRNRAKLNQVQKTPNKRKKRISKSKYKTISVPHSKQAIGQQQEKVHVAKKEEEMIQKQNQQAENSKQKIGKIRGPYKQYTESTKLYAISLYQSGLSFNKISNILKIPSKNVTRWCRNGPERKPGAGRKVMEPEMQQNLAKWIRSEYKTGQAIYVRIVRNRAKEMSKSQIFEASFGWFKNFAKRYGLKTQYKFI